MPGRRSLWDSLRPRDGWRSLHPRELPRRTRWVALLAAAWAAAMYLAGSCMGTRRACEDRCRETSCVQAFIAAGECWHLMTEPPIIESAERSEPPAAPQAPSPVVSEPADSTRGE